MAVRLDSRCRSLQQQCRRIFNQFLDPYQELNRLAAIDDAVVVAEGEVHHRPNHDLAVDGDWALLNFVHAEDANLGWAEDRRRQQRPENAAVGYRERAAT